MSFDITACHHYITFQLHTKKMDVVCTSDKTKLDYFKQFVWDSYTQKFWFKEKVFSRARVWGGRLLRVTFQRLSDSKKRANAWDGWSRRVTTRFTLKITFARPHTGESEIFSRYARWRWRQMMMMITKMYGEENVACGKRVGAISVAECRVETIPHLWMWINLIIIICVIIVRV